jgi:predicted DNA-binding protein
MAATEFIKARLPLELKDRVKALSEQRLLSESAWLKGLVIRELQAVAGDPVTAKSAARALASRSESRARQDVHGRRSGRVYVRLRKDDEQLLHARAAARGMRPATYISILTRAHLRRLAPLPKDELLALRRCIGELAAIGRNINQIARAANDGGRLPGSAREEFRAMLKVCEALRDSTKALLKANLTSWESGYGEDV